MKTYNNLYFWLSSVGNLTMAWRKARENKIANEDVVEFEKNIENNLLQLHYELKNKIYKPKPLKTFVLRDPKTRVISKSDFRDRVVHHALINVIKPIFEPIFIYDSCANQIGKGTIFALRRFRKFMTKVSDRIYKSGFCLKADIKHYFQNISHEILLSIIRKKITDNDVIWLIKKILYNNVASGSEHEKGMPLGNYTSQFFANVYLNELDYYLKHNLKVKYYIRYVDDFVIFHQSIKQLTIWKNEIDKFLKDKLRIELHPDKSRIIPISRGIDFVGFRNFYFHHLLRKRNIASIQRKIALYREGKKVFGEICEIYQGWQAYAKWGNTFKLRKLAKKKIIDILWDKNKAETSFTLTFII